MTDAVGTATTAEVGTDLSVAIDTIGSKLGRYSIYERIGVGGMGVVFRARDPALARDLAIKVVRAEGGGEAQARLLREAQAMARLRRPGVMPVFDVGILEGGVFIVMPYLAGGTLGRWLRAERRPWREVLDRFVAAGRGLAVAHAAGLVHRDFKPENVLLDDEGSPVVGDFGLARPARDAIDPATGGQSVATVDVTHSGTMAGTLHYMAPEQLLGDPVDARADVFAFCVSLHEGLFGERPFRADDGNDRFASQLGAIVNQRVREPPADRKVPGWLRAAIVHGLAVEPGARWPSMDALLAHVERRRRRPRRALAAGALAAAAAAVAVILSTRGESRSAPASPPRSYHRVRLTSRGDLFSSALAPDGRRLAEISTGGDLIVRELGGGGAERIVATNALRASWSSDGGRLVYAQRAGHVRAVELASGANTDLAESGALTSVVGTNVAVIWGIDQKRLKFVDLEHPDAPHWTCAIPGDYTWLRVVVPLSDGTIFVGTASKNTRDLWVDRVIQVDTHCVVQRVVADQLALSDVSNITHDDRLVGETIGPVRHLVEIDRDGGVRPLDAPVPDGPHSLVGVRPDGSVLDLESEQGWRLLRVSPDHAPVEVAAGASEAVIAMAPRGDRFAILETDVGSSAGAARVVDLAAPAVRSAPVETRALAVGWTEDERLVTLLARGDSTVLVVEGPHRVEHVVPAPSIDGRIVALGADEVAYVRQDVRTYVVVDVRTGATRSLVDPSVGYTSALSRSPRDGRLLMFWSGRLHHGGNYLLSGDHAELLPFPDDAFPVWTSTGDAMLVAHYNPPRIDRFDPATRATTPYVTDLGSRGQIFTVTPVGDRELFVDLRDLNSDVFAQTPSQ